MAPWLFWVVCGIYFLTTLAYLMYVVFGTRHLAQIALYLLLIGFGFHTVSFYHDVISQGYPYLYNQTDALQLVSWVSIILFLILKSKFQFQGAGAYFTPIALIFLVLSTFYNTSYHFEGNILASPWVVIHLFLVFIAFAIFLASMVVGIIFIMMESQVKHKRIRLFFQRLPSLDMLDIIHYRALTVGFIFLSLGILAGSMLSKDIRGVYLSEDPKQIWVLCMWFFFAILLNSHFRSGSRGRKGILLSLIGFASFVILVLVFLSIRHVY